MRPHVDTKGDIVHFSVTIDTTIEIKHRKILISFPGKDFIISAQTLTQKLLIP